MFPRNLRKEPRRVCTMSGELRWVHVIWRWGRRQGKVTSLLKLSFYDSSILALFPSLTLWVFFFLDYTYSSSLLLFWEPWGCFRSVSVLQRCRHLSNSWRCHWSVQHLWRVDTSKHLPEIQQNKHANFSLNTTSYSSGNGPSGRSISVLVVQTISTSPWMGCFVTGSLSTGCRRYIFVHLGLAVQKARR